MDANILKIVFYNVPIRTFKPKELVRIGATSKTNRIVSKDYFLYIASKYSIWLSEQIYGKQIEDTYNKRQCAELITLTEAKKSYKLDSDDVDVFDYILRYVHMYRRVITLFKKSDVIEVAMLKNAKTTYFELVEFLNKPKTNKALNKRKEQLENALKNSTIEEDARESKIAKQFIKNGSYGIRKLTKVFAEYDRLKLHYSQFDARTISPFDDYLTRLADAKLEDMIDIITDDNRQFVEARKREAEAEDKRNARKVELTKALQERNLKLRSDSTLCTKYIIGSDEKTLDEIVSIMENMDFLHKHTKYPQFMKTQMHKAYCYAHEDARDQEFETEFEYRDFVRDEIEKQKNDISMQCQKRAVEDFVRHNSYNKDIVPIGLRIFL